MQRHCASMKRRSSKNEWRECLSICNEAVLGAFFVGPSKVGDGSKDVDNEDGGRTEWFRGPHRVHS